MRLVPFHLHPKFSRLARTIVLAVYLFDTIVAALPTRPESGLVHRGLTSYELQLFEYKVDGSDNEDETVLCLDFVDLQYFCSPFDPEKTWIEKVDDLRDSPKLGVAHLADDHRSGVFSALRDRLAKCNVQNRRARWDCFDLLMAFLARSKSGLGNPEHILSEETMVNWETALLMGTRTKIEVLQDKSANTAWKTGDLTVRVGGEKFDFKTDSRSARSSGRELEKVYSGFVHFCTEDAMMKAIKEIYAAAIILNPTHSPDWLSQLESENRWIGSKPSWLLGWTQADNFVHGLFDKDSQCKYIKFKALPPTLLNLWRVDRDREIQKLVERRESKMLKNQTEYSRKRKRIEGKGDRQRRSQRQS
ncbi:hypothetical protein EV360DRAFT_80421 [Lentinula raphanica]|nr:hypothetical protein EV360DRAFT_80421 [Lentinula raphanica]